MSWSQLADKLGHMLGTKLFSLGGTTVTPKTILTVLLIIIVTYLVSRAICRTMISVFRRRGLEEDGNVLALTRLVHYSVLLVGFGVALQTAGFNLNALFAAGAVFAIGIGFAMQNLAQNFVSGVILLVERAIKPGDVLEVEHRVVRVVRMGIRSTIVQTRDGDHLIVPNATLVQSTVNNLTRRGAVHRIRAKVGVTYDSDLRLVQRTLEQTLSRVEWRSPKQEPRVLLLGFGDNSVNFDASVWTEEPWVAPRLLSRLNQDIWWALKEQGIVIAFPQLDVHFDEPVEKGLGGLALVR